MQLIIWILFSFMEGMREGAHFSHGNSKYPFNIHTFFVPVRALFAIALCIWSGSVFSMIAFMLTFPFGHDGSYYQTRHYIDKKSYNFFSQSTSTTAKFSVDFKTRSLMFYIGVWAYFLLP